MYLTPMITPGQIRAARAIIGWKQTDLAEASGVSEPSIKNIERGVTDARASTLNAIERAFAAHGVKFETHLNPESSAVIFQPLEQGK